MDEKMRVVPFAAVGISNAQ